jgi:NADH:ubiquinone oxidoreductase subunit 3 (subunit A)
MAQSLLDAYMPVAIFLAIAVIFPILVYFITRLVRPDKPSPLKDTTYECGEVPEGEAQIQFNFQYYMFALIFVVFDVAAIFLMLMALVFTGLSDAAKVAIILFVAVLFVTTNYALKKEEVLTI